MDFIADVNWLYSLSGLAVGILVGLTGVGGGSLMTPLLVLLFGVHPATAVGTDLLYAAATKTAGTAVHGWKGTVSWSIVWRLAAGSVPASALTLWWLSLQGERGEVGRLIIISLGLALLATSAAVLFRTRIVNFFLARSQGASPARTTAFTVILGAVLGVLVSLTSVGAGALGMTVLLILYPRTEVARLVGSDIAHAVPLTLLAGLGHWMLGSVDWSLLSSLLIGSVPGVIIGSLLASRTPDGLLRPILAITLALVAIRLLFG